jgi:hypothetical protein
MKLAGLWEDNGLVFTTRVGTPVSRQELITRSFKPCFLRWTFQTAVSTT